MKHLMLILSGSLLIVMAACNDNNPASESESQTADTLQKSSDNSAGTQKDTSASQANGKSMMASMMKHMDEMKKMKSMNDPDHDFAMMMKHHHAAAVEMAQVELSHGHHTEIKTMAQKMIDDQNKDIQQFDSFLNTPMDNKSGNDKFYKETMQMMNEMPMNMNLASADTDEQFVSMMIPHHEHAIHMATVYLKFGKNQEMKTVANKIIKDQQKEIKDLKDWQAKNNH